jgi:pimeloyl-ACP methyl ester carboxylesterase
MALLAVITPVIAWSTPVDPGIRVEEIEFASRGVKLSGSIVSPTATPAMAAVVFVHGSGKQSRNLHWAEEFARAGVIALVYDKRGAGKSGGVYEAEQSVSGMNIALLADDAAAALQALRSHPAARGVPAGLAGISQAGWIAPLAARKGGAKFLILWSAPVCKVSEEDIYSKYTADRDGQAVPPYREALAARETPYLWPDFLGTDTDPASTLAKLSIPGLWIFSDNDGSIPVDLSLSRLGALRAAGHPYEHLLFPGLGHNNMDGTFTAAIEWLKRTLAG